MIEKLKREIFGPRNERKARLIDQMELELEELQAAAAEDEREQVGSQECQWQRDQLPDAIRDLVLDDQQLRNDICWSVFDC